MLCFEFRIIDIQYFMDELEEWQIVDIINNLKYVDRIERENSRAILYTLIQSNSKKKIKIGDIADLPWDHKMGPYDEKEDRDLFIQANEMEYLLNSGKIIIPESKNKHVENQYVIENEDAASDLFMRR